MEHLVERARPGLLRVVLQEIDDAPPRRVVLRIAEDGCARAGDRCVTMQRLGRARRRGVADAAACCVERGTYAANLDRRASAPEGAVTLCRERLTARMWDSFKNVDRDPRTYRIVGAHPLVGRPPNVYLRIRRRAALSHAPSASEPGPVFVPVF
jgi:hypothetical protein